MIEKKVLTARVSRRLEAGGFRRKGSSWYLHGPDAIAVVALQKSDFGERVFLNVGVWLRALGPSEFPRENHCHLQYRAEALFPDRLELVRSATSLEEATESDLDRLETFVDSELIPLCRESLDIQNLRALYSAGRLSNGLVLKEARAALGETR